MAASLVMPGLLKITSPSTNEAGSMAVLNTIEYEMELSVVPVASPLAKVLFVMVTVGAVLSNVSVEDVRPAVSVLPARSVMSPTLTLLLLTENESVPSPATVVKESVQVVSSPLSVKVVAPPKVNPSGLIIVISSASVKFTTGSLNTMS